MNNKLQAIIEGDTRAEELLELFCDAQFHDVDKDQLSSVLRQYGSLSLAQEAQKEILSEWSDLNTLFVNYKINHQDFLEKIMKFDYDLFLIEKIIAYYKNGDKNEC